MMRFLSILSYLFRKSCTIVQIDAFTVRSIGTRVASILGVDTVRQTAFPCRSSRVTPTEVGLPSLNLYAKIPVCH